MAKGTFDKREGKRGKGGRPRKAASKENAKASVSGAEPAAAEKPKQTRNGAADRAAEKEKEEKQATKGVRKALRKAVKKAVKKECEKIAQALVKETQKGNMRSTAVVLSMIEKRKKDSEGAKRHGGLTAADLLGSEEEWESETAEAMEKQGTENRDQRTEISGQ